MDEPREAAAAESQDEEMNDPGVEQVPNVTSSSTMDMDEDEATSAQDTSTAPTSTVSGNSAAAEPAPQSVTNDTTPSTTADNIKSEAITPVPTRDSTSAPPAQDTTTITDEKAKNESTTKVEVDHIKPEPTPVFKDPEDAKWHTVGIFQGLSATVTSYIDNRTWTSSGLELTSDNLPDVSQYPRINLEPGTAYRFRLRAINSVGASDWSEISSFKTCLPGFPGAPSAIKISKSSEGAHLTWEPPPTCQNTNEIVEYSVYLAVKPAKEKDKTGTSPQRAPAQLAFVRVYVGATNQCTVSHTSLAAAHVDCSNKPAIIFRIAARNEKGYGPATQVRWLQDPVQSAITGAGNLLSPPRVKSELGGASPSKRFKTGAGVLGKMPPPSQAGNLDV